MSSSVEQHHPDLIPTLQRYKDLFTFAPVGYVLLSRDLRIIDINRTAAAMLGWPRSWLIGQALARWVHWEDLETFVRHVGTARSSDTAVSDRLRLKDRRGRWHDVRLDSIATIARNNEKTDCQTAACQTSMIEVGEQRAAERR